MCSHARAFSAHVLVWCALEGRGPAMKQAPGAARERASQGGGRKARRPRAHMAPAPTQSMCIAGRSAKTRAPAARSAASRRGSSTRCSSASRRRRRAWRAAPLAPRPPVCTPPPLPRSMARPRAHSVPPMSTCPALLCAGRAVRAICELCRSWPQLMPPWSCRLSEPSARTRGGRAGRSCAAACAAPTWRSTAKSWPTCCARAGRRLRCARTRRAAPSSRAWRSVMCSTVRGRTPACPPFG